MYIYIYTIVIYSSHGCYGRRIVRFTPCFMNNLLVRMRLFILYICTYLYVYVYNVYSPNIACREFGLLEAFCSTLTKSIATRAYCNTHTYCSSYIFTGFSEERDAAIMTIVHYSIILVRYVSIIMPCLFVL